MSELFKLEVWFMMEEKL